MQTITTICLDIAKSVFQVRGVDADGNVVLRRQLKRVDAEKTTRLRRSSKLFRLRQIIFAKT